MLKKILFLVLLTSISACQHSPRKEYVALGANAPDFSIAEPAPADLVIGVGPVQLPEYLQHPKVGYWKTPYQLILLDNDYWAEPLERGITRVLALALQNTHEHWRVVQFPWASSARPDYALRVDIQRLDAFANRASIEANIDWVDTRTKQVVARKQLRAQVASTATAADIALAFSQLLHTIAQAVPPPAAAPGG